VTDAHEHELAALRVGAKLAGVELVRVPDDWLGPFKRGLWHALAAHRASIEGVLEVIADLRPELRPDKKMDAPLLGSMAELEPLLREQLARLNALPWPKKL
jgi:hypothetical protein